MDDKIKEHDCRLRSLETISNEHTVRLAEIKKDTEYIRTKIDNGLTHSLQAIAETISELAPAVKDNKEWVGRIKFACFWITVIAVVGSIVKYCLDLVKAV